MKFTQSILFALPGLILSSAAFSQQIMSVKITDRCIYTGGTMDEELYRFENSDKVPEWVQEILEACGAEMNFKLIQTNVENVSAVLDGDTRYLFYSTDFIQKASRTEVYGALAHEIGHHANNHTFDPGHRSIEESEADFFMGYFFSKKNIGKVLWNELLVSLPSSYGIPAEDRLKSISKGYERAGKALTLEGLAFDHDPKLQELLLPAFTFKECYTSFDLPSDKFSGVRTLAKADEKIRLALDLRGYNNRSYFSVKDGFAVVTQMEQYNLTDGTIRNDRTRWFEYPARDNFDGVMDYLTSVFWANKGYFRLFVFVVTNSAFKASDEKVAKSEAAAWLGQGANRLPNAIGNMAFTSDYVVSALVYEFEVPEANRKAKQVCPVPHLDARSHIIKSGLGRGFGL